MTTPAPYGYEVVFTCGSGQGPVEKRVRRKGTEAAARKAAVMTSCFQTIISITPISAEEAPAPRKSRAEQPLDCSAVTQNTGPKPLLPEEYDIAANAVLTIKAAGAELAMIAERKRQLLRSIESGTAIIDRLIPEFGARPNAASDQLRSRCSRVQELINSEELESWNITIGNLMEQAWHRLS